MQELINLFYYYADRADEAMNTNEEVFRMYTILKTNLARLIFDNV